MNDVSIFPKAITFELLNELYSLKFKEMLSRKDMIHKGFFQPSGETTDFTVFSFKENKGWIQEGHGWIGKNGMCSVIVFVKDKIMVYTNEQTPAALTS